MPPADPLPHLIDTVRRIVRAARVDLPPVEKLELLCTQIGTAIYWLDRLDEAARRGNAPLAGPHRVGEISRRDADRADERHERGA